MIRVAKLLATCLAVLAISAPSAHAAFGLFDFDVEFREADGSAASKAATHPFAMTTSFGVNFGEGADGVFSEGRIRHIFVQAPPGLIANAGAVTPCSSLEFFEDADEDDVPDCPVGSQVGVTAASSDVLKWTASPIFSVTPPPGVLLRLAWNVEGVANIVLDLGLTPSPPYTGFASSRNTPQAVEVVGVKTQLWGDPTDPRHDHLRGACLRDRNDELAIDDIEGFQFEGTGSLCTVPRAAMPFLTLPTSCGAPLAMGYEAVSWGDLDEDGRADLDSGGTLIEPLDFCGALPAFDPTITATPTSRAAESPSGLEFSLQIADEGLTSNEPGARAKSHIRRVEVTLPQGMTANPSLAEGLEVCSEQELDEETLASGPGEGCPQASKIGTIEVDSPVVSETVKGALYQAEPFANLADDSLIAFYIVLRNHNLGILVKQAVKVEADPETGQLRAITDEAPQVPFSSFRLKFREGARSPLITPPTCDSDPSTPQHDPHSVSAEITPWSGGPVARSVSRFTLVSGPNEGPCPPSGVQPFEPGFEAGSVNNSAGAFSPFAMRLTRRDGDQDLVRLDVTLPPGVLAKLAGVERCTDAQIAQAKGRSGRVELASPSCPPGSRIGRVTSGAGVGSQLTYVKGTLYLGGPFAGAPLSAVAIVPAVAGPFDVGTVVVRQALRVNPVTGAVTADGASSDPLPHILAGIPLRVRDVQVEVDRPGFTLNPTSCEEMTVQAQIWGGGLNPFSLLDNAPVMRGARYQAADCARLGFSPALSLQLKGGTRRGAHPALRAVLRPRPDDANLKRTVVRFPRATFLEQAHIRTVCTRVQFAADACPPGSIYGHVTVFTPLLDEPLRGPVYLRSSDNKLPDVVFDLKGLVDIEAAARADSIRGKLRITFAAIPDAPVSKVVVEMQGGRKGLLVNSRNLCGPRRPRASVSLAAHNGKRAQPEPLLAARCAKGRKG